MDWWLFRICNALVTGDEIPAVVSLPVIFTVHMQLTMEVAKIIREDFLQQNAFSEWDYVCPLPKAVGMMRIIMQFYTTALSAIKGTLAEKPFTWAVISTTLKPIIIDITQMKFMVRRVRIAQ